jgi:hypothetical protein
MENMGMGGGSMDDSRMQDQMQDQGGSMQDQGGSMQEQGGSMGDQKPSQGGSMGMP